MPESEDPGLEEVLARFGWEATAIFWHKYHEDAWVFNLANALVSTYRLLEEKVGPGGDIAILEKIEGLGVDGARLRSALDGHDNWGALVHSFVYLTVCGVVADAFDSVKNRAG